MALTSEQFQKLLEQNFQQQQSIIAALTKQKSGNMTKCKCFFNGEKETEKVESFLSAIELFRKLEKISDDDFIQGLPLVLHKEAGTWWQGVKEEIRTVAEFESRLREKFSPLKLPHLLYQELMTIVQSASESTEKFITNKRMLFSLLPEPKHLEPQQLDMIYHLLRLDIRDKTPRSSFATYNQLLESAKGIEQINKEKKTSHSSTSLAPSVPRGGKNRCSFCKNTGHTIAECRKKKRIESQAEHTQASKGGQSQTQGPSSPSQPKFSCYGCGAPNVVRTNCPTCSHQKSKPIKEEIGFCSLSIRHETRPRPVIPATIGGIKGYPYIDTCAKTNVASYSLYCRLQEQGYGFKEEKVELTLADGVTKNCTVLTVRVDVEIHGRVFPTNFMILPESRRNKTLLGIGFLTKAMMVLNIPQFTWHFIDNPYDIHELFTEDFVKFKETLGAVSHMNAQWQAIMPHKTSVPIDALTMSSTASIITSDASIPDVKDDASLPVDSAQNKRKYELKKITFGTPKRGKMLFDGYSPRLNYMYRDAQMNLQNQEVELSPHSQTLFPDASDIGINTVDIELPHNDEMTPDRQSQWRSLLSSFKDVFTLKNEPAKHVTHAINTENKAPISVPPYRLSQPRREILRKEIDKMIQDGIIEPRITPWAAPVVLVPKKNGEIRVCIDYRRLNSITVPDSYPIPRIDDLLHEAKPTSFMSSLDLKAGYWQIEVNKEDIDKTGFITPFGIYVCRRMPFGLRNAPATFQRLIDRFRVSLIDVKVLAYLDDLIVFSASFDSHLADLAKILTKMREFNLTVNPKKCKFCCSTIKYLGHYITPSGLKMDPEKTAAIVNLPTPSNLRHLVTFLQTCSWYRRFIENFSAIAEPLTKLTKKGARWTWTSSQQKSYDELKRRLTTAPILRQADDTKPFIIKTDASSYALGAVLVQGEGENEHPVEYASRLLTQVERNYSTTEREALSVVWAVTKFRGYIEGVPVTVVTDHQALKWLMSLKSPTGKLARWALQLQAYNINIQYKPGRTNVVADTLSRPPCTEEGKVECGICTVIVDMPTRSQSEIRAEQLKDSFISRIVEALEKDENENATYWSNKGYFTNNGLLYRLAPDSDDDDAQLVAPEHEWADILAAYHDDPMAGHYGAEKTFARISKRYYWRGMRKYIDAYVQNCLSCQRYKPTNLKPAGLLQTTAINKRFETISLDLFGPLPASPDGKVWILIVQDNATRWVELFALQNATAEACAETLLKEVILRYGLPRRLTSDNGSQFVSAVMQKLCFCLGIKHTFTPIYHPQANPVERRNRDLKTQLGILVEGDHGNWPAKLASIRFAMNTATCSSTGNTPAYLTFGRELRTTEDVQHDFRQIVESENFIVEITPKLKSLAYTMKKAREIQEMKEEARKEYFDQQRRESPRYKVNDLVLANVHPISRASKGYSSKLTPRRDGPYMVVAQAGPASYKLANIGDPDTIIGTYHASSLKPYKGSTGELPAPVQPLRKRGRPRKNK